MLEILRRNKLIYNILLFCYFVFITCYYRFFLLIFSLFRINNKKVIIVNYDGKGFGDNGKYICNELLNYDYDIYRATKKVYMNSLPKNVKYVEYNSLKYLYHLATAKVWINNSRFLYGIGKRKSQFYIQTWHGCFALKKVEAATENSLSKYYILSAKNDSKMANLFISNSLFCTNFYKKYFWYDGNILEYGCPRNDIIINKNEDLIGKVRDYFGFLDSERICLYAPTFRVNYSLDIYNINYENLLSELNNKFKGNWKLLIRLHPNISYLANQLYAFNKHIINVTNYPDMQELLLATDFLITDYSSCIFDYALSGKPAMIYASDIEEYKKDRDFEIKLESTPFPIATNNIELKKVISSYNIDKYKENLNKFYDEMGLKETGQSCKKISEIIYELTEVKKKK